ncbi:MAG TPA: FAD-dependent oxidoreductase [Planctomycetota bacterium]|nr:FAD-dependent oxidoreductase [Planctomycetota bacterium]
MNADGVQTLVLGAGWRGLLGALRSRRERPEASLAVLEAAPHPGGSIRTLRTNGFVCELGPFAFPRAEIEPALALLQRAPPLVDALPGAAVGMLFTGDALAPIAVDPAPVSFRTGAEEFVQACRRELGDALRLGRAATAIRPDRDGWSVDLGGEVPSTLRTQRLLVALPIATAAHLLAPLDPALAASAERLQKSERAFAFFGGHAGDAPELRGHGILPAEGLETPLAEAIFCTQVFAGRALPGRFLVRCELGGPTAGDDASLLAVAEAELRRWTGLRCALPFQKLHRFLVEEQDAARVECRVRLAGLAARAPGLTML